MKTTNKYEAIKNYLAINYHSQQQCSKILKINKINFTYKPKCVPMNYLQVTPKRLSKY